MRHWIVLLRLDEGRWQEVTSLRAWSAKGAIEKVAASGTAYGYYLAIPLRWWRPSKVG